MSTKWAGAFIRLSNCIDDGDFTFRAPINLNRNIFYRFAAADWTDFIIRFDVAIFAPHLNSHFHVQLCKIMRLIPQVICEFC